jgi:hypothetical protein
MVAIKTRPRRVTGRKRTTTIRPRKVDMFSMLPDPISLVVDSIKALFEPDNLWVPWSAYVALLTWIGTLLFAIPLIVNLAGAFLVACCTWTIWLIIALRDVA